MNDHEEPQHRAFHQPDPDRVEVRDDGSDGTFTVRMPIASTGEVRNQGDDPLERNEIAGMARQIEERAVGVFLDHGRNRQVAGSRYSATGKVGEWQNPEVVQRDGGADLLEAEARLMDPDTMSGDTGSVREALAAVKAQVERGFALSSSIGWREDDSAPGGNDLMEASIVGIGADPRTTSDGSPAEAMARAALAERDDVDAERLVEEFRAVVMGPEPEDREVRETVSETESEASSDAATEAEQDATNDEQTEQATDAEEFRSQMLEMQRQQTEMQKQQSETLSAVAESLREDDEDDEDEEEEDEDEDDEEQAAGEPDDEQSGSVLQDAETIELEVDGEVRTAEDVVDEHREALSALQAGGISLEDVDFGEQDVATTEEEAEAEASEREESDDERTSDSDATQDTSSGWLDS